MTEIITTSSRSEGAKRAWERRKAQEGEKSMKNDLSIKPWVFHAEWLALMVTLVGCFIFCFRETVHTNDRMDAHIEAINRRADQISTDSNRRCDELHKEFYDLLKETRK